MTRTLLPLPIALLVACAETSPDGNGEPDSPETPTAGELQVARAETSPDPATEDALAAASAIALAFQFDEVPEFSEDGEFVVVQMTEPPERCARFEFDSNELTVFFETCDRVAGTLRIDVPRFGPTTFNFEDDFTVDGRDLDGSLTLDLMLAERSFEASGMVTLDGTTDVTIDVDISALGGVALWGEASVDDGTRSAIVTTGTEAAPLTWSLDCTCPVSGAIEGDTTGSIDAITVDYDDLVQPFDGEDDFPPFVVPITPAPVTSRVSVDFEPGCGAQTVDATATDIEIRVTNEDLRAPLTEACANGDVEPDDCARAELLLDNLAEDIRIVVPTEAIAESLEDELDAIVSQVCFSR